MRRRGRTRTTHALVLVSALINQQEGAGQIVGIKPDPHIKFVPQLLLERDEVTSVGAIHPGRRYLCLYEKKGLNYE